MEFRELSKGDYDHLVDIHMLAFNDFFLTSPGKRGLMTYYKVNLKSSESVAIRALYLKGLSRDDLNNLRKRAKDTYQKYFSRETLAEQWKQIIG